MSNTFTTASIDETLRAELAALCDQGLARALRVVGQRRGALVETEFGPTIDFSSNDYLGLAGDPRLVTAAAAALYEHGVGATASRLLAGNNPEHMALETAIAEFFGAEASLSFSSGYSANIGILPALVGRGDVIFADALNHASLIDGCRLSRATVYVYPHCDGAILASLLSQHRRSYRRAIIATDGVFSMDGGAAPIEQIVDLAHAHDAWTYLDDAHAAGVIGEEGKGCASAAGVHGAVDVTIGTLGKAFGAAGAYVYGSALLCQYLLNRARSFVFSTAMLPAQAAAARAGLIVARAEPGRRETTLMNARLARAALRDAGIEPMRSDGGGGAEGSSDHGSYIIPICIGDAERTMSIGATLAARGFLVGAVRPPTVPSGTSRLRIAVGAAHTEEQIRNLVAALAVVMRE